VSDPFLFDEDDAPVDAAAIRVRDTLLDAGYQEEDDFEPPKPKPLRRTLKWVLVGFFGVLIAVHVYAATLRFVNPPGTLLMAGQTTG